MNYTNSSAIQNEPLVSVVITSYNQRNQLFRAIKSVLAQSYSNIQIVIADDYSTKDDSRELIQEFSNKYPKKIKPVLQSKNLGIPRNKNAGFKACDGDFITYLDGDDYYYQDKIKTEIETFKKKPWADIVYSNFVFTDFNTERNKKWKTNNFKPIERDIFEKAFVRDFPYNTLYRCELMKKKVLKAIDYYDENIRAFHDWDSRIRMTKVYNVAYNKYIGSAYVEDPKGISKQSKKEELLNEMKYVVSKNHNLLNDLPHKEKIINKINDFFFLMQVNIDNSISGIIKYLIKHPISIKGYKSLVRILLFR